MPCLFAQLILTPLLSHVRKPKSQDIRQTNSDYQLMARQKLPLGIQDFEELRRGGYLYVDKTDMLWKIANGNKYNFLSRPRRFGKSLLTSAMQCYFEGRRELFEGLRIMDIEKEWVKRPVLHFSMNQGGSDVDSLSHYLDDSLATYEEIYGKRPTEMTLSNRFTGIIQRAYERSGVQIAILVDEYDAPLQHSFMTPQHEACRSLYRDFFTGLKDYGYCIKCVFLTGITKFTQISLFSVLNTVTNISFYDDYATVCGLTSDEIEKCFKEELKSLSEKRGWEALQTLKNLKEMYDGYHFSESLQGVFNPYSVLCALKEQRLKSFWIASGATEMLPKLLKNFERDVEKLDGSLIDMDYLETADVSVANPKLFLYQSGYLTIKDVVGDSYVLGFPNREVKKALFEMVIPNMLHQSLDEVENAIQEMKVEFSVGHVDEGVRCLKQLIAHTPYSTQKKEHFVFEEHFRFIVKNLFYICGFHVEEEVQMSNGRIDLVVHTPDILYVLELKMKDNGGCGSAERQLNERHYEDAFCASHCQIVCLALEFDKDNRGLVAWKNVALRQK